MFKSQLLLRILLNNNLSILDMWKLSLSVFSTREKVFKIQGINVHLILFDEKPNDLGILKSIVLDEAAASEGFIWVDNDVGKNVPCILYRVSRMNRRHRPVDDNDFCYIVNEAVTEAKYAKEKSVVILESLYDPGLFGWFITSVEIGLDIVDEDNQVEFSYYNFISKDQ